MGLSFSIALRFLKSGRGQTILILLGISIGVAVQVFIGSLIIGLQNSLINTTIGNSSQVTITKDIDDKLIDGWKRLVYEVEISNQDIKNVSVAADGAGFASSDNDTFPILIRGFDIKKSDRIYNLSKGLYDGRLPQNDGEVIIGKELALKLGISVNDEISVSTPNSGSSGARVVGLFDLKVVSINKTWLVSNLATAQDILGLDNKVTSVEMQVKEVFNADVVAKDVEYTISDKELKVADWKSQNKQLLSGLNGQSVSSYMIQVFVLVAVLLGISSVLAVSVVQKSKQLGILKAMGIKDWQASMVFVFQGMVLGVLGAIVGILFGYGLLQMFTVFAVNADGTPVVPVSIDPIFLMFSGGFALASAMIASVIPARLSSRLNPIEVIKNG